jgi:hypothetical protein
MEIIHILIGEFRLLYVLSIGQTIKVKNMRVGASWLSENFAKNTGLAKTSSIIAKKEIKKARQVADLAHYVDSVDSKLFKFATTSRKCSCMEYASTDGSVFAQDDDLDAPVLLLQASNIEQPEELLNEALEILHTPKDICPVCYGTGYVGNYRLLNSYELFFETKYKAKKKKNVGIQPGRPYYFQPTSKNSSIIFTANLPLYFLGIDRITYIPISSRVHKDLDRSLIRIAPAGEALVDFNSIDLNELVLESTKVDIEFQIKEPVHGFFFRIKNGATTIKINFPKLSDGWESGEYDYWDSMSVSVDSTEPISTSDIVYDSKFKTCWKITGLEHNEPLNQDVGKEVEMRRAKEFEVFSLLP